MSHSHFVPNESEIFIRCKTQRFHECSCRLPGGWNLSDCLLSKGSILVAMTATGSKNTVNLECLVHMSPKERACRKCSFQPGDKLAARQVAPQTSSAQSRAREAAVPLFSPGPPHTAQLYTIGSRRANYPAGTSSSPGEPQTGRGAPPGLPQMPLPLGGSATSKHILLCSKPVEDTLLSAALGAVHGRDRFPCVPPWRASPPHSPSWQCTTCGGLPRRRGWGNSAFYSGSFSGAFLWRHLGQSTSTRASKSGPAELPNEGLLVILIVSGVQMA